MSFISGVSKGGSRSPIRGGAYHWREYGIEELLPPLQPEIRVLLLGCGDGGEKPSLHARGWRTVGLDIRRAGGADVLADAHALPFSGEAFDLVLSMQVLEHLVAPWTAVDEVARVLRSGGWFLGSVAFLKPYHGSYFHMSYRGVKALLDRAGLEADTFQGAQSLTYSLFGDLFPWMGVRLRRGVLGSFDRLLLGLRARVWSATRRSDPDRSTNRFDSDIPLSFRAHDRLRKAPAVVFRARKPGNGTGP